jgi:hypothetical protein
MSSSFDPWQQSYYFVVVVVVVVRGHSSLLNRFLRTAEPYRNLCVKIFRAGRVNWFHLRASTVASAWKFNPSIYVKISKTRSNEFDVYVAIYLCMTMLIYISYWIC